MMSLLSPSGWRLAIWVWAAFAAGPVGGGLYPCLGLWDGQFHVDAWKVVGELFEELVRVLACPLRGVSRGFAAVLVRVLRWTLWEP